MLGITEPDSAIEIMSSVTVDIEKQQQEVISDVDITLESNSTVDTQSRIKALERVVSKQLEERKEQAHNVLPCRKTVRFYHGLVAVYVEGAIGKEIAKNECFIVPGRLR